MTVDLGVPVLQTERLLLREHRLDDFPAIAAMWADPAVTKYIGGNPRPEEECWLKFLRAAGFWTHLGFGYWIIEEKRSGAVIGECGFGDFKRDMTPSIAGKMEMGWALAAQVHGRGLASEAVAAALQWADDHKAGLQICCLIEENNAASIRIAEKNGFSETLRTHYHDHEIILFDRARTQS